MPKKLTYKFVKEQIESFNYQLISKEYKNVNVHLLLKCDKGHEYKVKYNNFKQGSRCPYCNVRGGHNKFTYDFIKEQIESVDGYKLLSKEYINNATKLSIQCNKGHIYEVKYNSFQRGARCPECYGNKKLTYDFIKEQVESIKGYELLSKEYVNAISYLKVKCDEGHEYSVRWTNFQRGYRCPICNIESISSKPEKEIQEYIKSFNHTQVNNDRSTILNTNTGHFLELDIYLPDLNKAIEFNGTYWHSLSNVKDHDIIKQKECERLGINLLTIYEEDYMNNKEMEFDKIRKFIVDDIGLDKKTLKAYVKKLDSDLKEN